MLLCGSKERVHYRVVSRVGDMDEMMVIFSRRSSTLAYPTDSEFRSSTDTDFGFFLADTLNKTLRYPRSPPFDPTNKLVPLFALIQSLTDNDEVHNLHIFSVLRLVRTFHNDKYLKKTYTQVSRIVPQTLQNYRACGFRDYLPQRKNAHSDL